MRLTKAGIEPFVRGRAEPVIAFDSVRLFYPARRVPPAELPWHTTGKFGPEAWVVVASLVDGSEHPIWATSAGDRALNPKAQGFAIADARYLESFLEQPSEPA